MTQPYSMTPPPPAPTKRRRTWWIWAIPVAGVIVLGLLISAGVAEFNALVNRRPPEAALATGAPGSPKAAEPLACPSSCFTAAANKDLIPNYPVLMALGASYDFYPPGTYDPVTAGEVYRSGLADWRGGDGSPDVCFFAPFNAPVGSSVSDGQDQVSDAVTFVGTWQNKAKTSFVDVSSRVFPDTESASGYLHELATNIQNCHRIEIGPDNNRLIVTVQPAASITVPNSEAAVGWVRLGSGANHSRAYVMDIQRGNLVARVRVVTDGSISEAKFRSFAATFAQTILGPLPIE